MRDFQDLHDYQDRAITQLVEHDEMYLVAPVGAGKTVISMTALRELMEDGVVTRPLIIAPKNVAENVWPNEAAEWSHLAGLTTSVILGTVGQRVKAMQSPADVHVATYDNLQWLCAQPLFSQYDALVLDEASRVKNPKGKRSKALFGKIKQFNTRWLMSGTPSPNGVVDLFNQVKLMSAGEAWGSSYYKWEAARWWIDRYTYERTPKYPDVVEEVTEEFAALSYAVELEDIPRNGGDQHLVTYFTLNKTEWSAYLEMEKTYLAVVDTDTAVSAPSKAVVVNKLRQLASGFVYDTETGIAHQTGTTRRDALLQLLEDIGDEPVMIGYQFKEELYELLKMFPDAPFIGAGAKNVPETIEQWNAGTVPILLVHPQSAGHGLNMQYGPGHRLIWFTLPWSREDYEQLIGRLSRQGQRNRVQIHYLLDKDTVDLTVMYALRDKGNLQKSVIDAIKARQS